MSRHIALLALMVVLFSCNVDYKMKHDGVESRAVVNALLSPQEDFTVKLFWSGVYSGDSTRFRPVANARIRLTEDGDKVLDLAASPDGTTPTAFRPTAGRRYRLEVDIPGYGRLSASTEVPEIPSVDIRSPKKNERYSHFELSRIETDPNTTGLWITGTSKNVWLHPIALGRQATPTDTERDIIFGGDDDPEPEEIDSYHTASLFVDQVNAAGDVSDAQNKGALVSFSDFLHITQENFILVLPLRFSVYGFHSQYSEYRYTLTATAASKAYDLYKRSLYKQQNNSGGMATGNPFIEQVTVYSNIDNGLGIFAGYNSYKTPEL